MLHLPILSADQVANGILLFHEAWAENPCRNLPRQTQEGDDTHPTVANEFYHGACRFFATALAATLGLDRCRVYNLMGRHPEGEPELIHSIVDYLPLRPEGTTLDVCLAGSNYQPYPTYDIESADGRAFDQACYVFVLDPYENICPFAPNDKWPDEQVSWEQESSEAMTNLVSACTQGDSPSTEDRYWRAIRDCLAECFTAVLRA